jgi:hypothetical protein
VESLGVRLKSARESQHLSYDYISREVNIAGRYLEALEAEDFSIFPGEVYALGFLKSYGEYLGFNAAELMALYQKMKLQEQPVPVEQLLKRKREFPFKIVARVCAALAVAALLAGGVYVVIHLPKREPSAPKPRKAREYVLIDSSLERRLSLNDSFIVPYNGTQYRFTLTHLGEALTIAGPGGDILMDLGQEVVVDIDDDGFSELRITAADFVKNKASTGARLRFEMDNSPPPVALEEAETNAVRATAVATVIFASPTPYPFSVQISFQGFCLFRWEILAERDRPGRNEQYFERNRELIIQAQNGVRIGVSNAASIKMQAIGGGRTVPLELGGAGEVIVAEIHWVKDDENRYRLVLVQLD